MNRVRLSLPLCLLCLLVMVLSGEMAPQESTSSNPDVRKMPITLHGTTTLRNGMREVPLSSKFATLRITNNLHRPIFVVVRGDGHIVFGGNMPASTAECVFDTQSLAQLELPLGSYSVSAKADGYFANAVDVQASSIDNYYVEVGTEPGFCGETKQASETADTSNPPKAQTESSIQAHIDQIAAGAHQELPQPVQTSITAGQSPGWSIENATGYQLHLYLSGPAERDFVIQNGGSINIDLPPGSYRIAAEVSNKAVKPFYAVRQLDVNARWSSHFHIARE